MLSNREELLETRKQAIRERTPAAHTPPWNDDRSVTPWNDDRSVTNPVADLNASALETQVGGNHYKSMSIQPVEYITANNLSFLEGNVVKYVSRHRTKNGLEDLLKAKHYLDMIIEGYKQG